MAEPTDHTLRVLRDMRGEIRDLDRKVTSLDTKVDKGFSDLREAIDGLAQALAGEMVTRRHTDAKVDGRLAALEKRVTKLERAR